MNRLLTHRKVMKSKKPNFLRQQGRGVTSLAKSWRYPKGMHSKLRKKFRGKIKQPSIGYSSPEEVRGLHSSGLKPLLVFTRSQLLNIKNDEGVILSAKIGKRKKIELLKEIKEKKIQLINIKNIESYISKIETEKQEKKKKKTEKEKKQKKEEKKEIERISETPEEKEKREKEEKRLVLEGKK